MYFFLKHIFICIDSFEESIGSNDDPTYTLNNDVSSNE